VRGIANSKSSILMQELVCGRWSVCGHPKAIEIRRHRALKLSLWYGNDMGDLRMGGQVNCQKSEHNRSWRRPYNVLAEATHGEIVVRRQDFCGVIDLLLSWRENVGRKRGRRGGECRGKFQVLRQGERAEAMKLQKIGVDGLLIKIAESEGLWVDA
ncbi:hypothetical protein GW17_00041345, partial [Ensete ventricosum]